MGIFPHTKISANSIKLALKTNMVLPHQYKRRKDNCYFHAVKISIQLYIIKKALYGINVETKDNRCYNNYDKHLLSTLHS